MIIIASGGIGLSGLAQLKQILVSGNVTFSGVARVLLNGVVITTGNVPQYASTKNTLLVNRLKPNSITIINKSLLRLSTNFRQINDRFSSLEKILPQKW